MPDDIERCPVCGNDTLIPGERVDCGFGEACGPQIEPDHCDTCGYVQQGPDPDDLPIEHYRKCWELQIDPSPTGVPCRRHERLPEPYQQWIWDHVEGDGYGKCRETSLAMLADFPELKLVIGHYYCTSWGERDHFWLIDPQGRIVDPTFMQFPSKGRGHYAGRLVPPSSWIFKESHEHTLQVPQTG